MKKIKYNMVASNKEPNKYNIWIKNNKVYRFGNKGWDVINNGNSTYNDISRIINVLSNSFELDLANVRILFRRGDSIFRYENQSSLHIMDEKILPYDTVAINNLTHRVMGGYYMSKDPIVLKEHFKADAEYSNIVDLYINSIRYHITSLPYSANPFKTYLLKNIIPLFLQGDVLKNIFQDIPEDMPEDMIEELMKNLLLETLFPILLPFKIFGKKVTPTEWEITISQFNEILDFPENPESMTPDELADAKSDFLIYDPNTNALVFLRTMAE